MAALLCEMNHAAHKRRLPKAKLAGFLARYDALVCDGLAANPQPPHQSATPWRKSPTTSPVRCRSSAPRRRSSPASCRFHDEQRSGEVASHGQYPSQGERLLPERGGARHFARSARISRQRASTMSVSGGPRAICSGATGGCRRQNCRHRRVPASSEQRPIFMSAKPQEPRGVPVPRRAALAQPLLDAVVSPNEPTSARAGSSEPDIEPLLRRAALGVLDDHLAQIAQVVNTRLRAIDAVEELMASSRLHVGDKVRLGHKPSDPSTSTAEVRRRRPGW